MPEARPTPFRILWVLLVAAAAAWVAWPRAPGSRPAPREDVLLSGESALGSDGALFAFRVERPGPVEIDVRLLCNDPATTPATWVEVGPPGPVPAPAGNFYAPDPRASHRWRVEGTTTPPLRRVLYTVGTYALRVEPFPVAMGEMPPRVRVKVSAARTEPPKP